MESLNSGSTVPANPNDQANQPAVERNDEDIRRFLEFLAHEHGEPDKEIFTFGVMDSRSDDVLTGLGTVHATIDQALHLLDLNAGATLHVTLNRTNMKGRKTKDIVSARVLCVDMDREIATGDVQSLITNYAPGMIVESSPGRYHLYWKLDSILKLEVWSDYQLCLAHSLQADLSLRQITHTIRVPGVPRLKGGMWLLPRIVYLDPNATALETPPWEEWRIDINAAIASAKTLIAEQSKQRKLVTRQLLKNQPVTGNLAGIGRNEAMLGHLIDVCKHAQKKGEVITFEDLILAAGELNCTFSKGELPGEEVVGLCRKVLARNNEFAEKREEKRKERKERVAALLNALPIQSEVSLNGVHVNGAAPIATSDSARAEAAAYFKYDYSKGLLKEEPFSDHAMVERVMQRFGSSMLKVSKIVYAFDAKHRVWRSQKGSPELINRFVTQCATDSIHDPLLKRECMKLCGPKADADAIEKKLITTRKALLSLSLASMCVNSILNNDEMVKVNIGFFDAQPFKFFCANGVLDLLTGELREASPQDLLLRQSPVVFDSSAVCPWFEQFIAEIYSENEEPAEMVRCIQEVFGYSLSGSTDEQVLCVHSGDGANGKSRVLGVLAALLGDYSARLQAGALTKGKNSLEKEIARMGVKVEGKRAMIIDDLDTKAQWDDSIIKTFTERTITARNLYEEERDVPNRAKFHVACNQKPEMEAIGIAMKRRIKIIEYRRTFNVVPAKVEEIDRMVTQELSGILNWCIAGLKRIRSRQQYTIDWPKEVTASTEEYWENQAGIEDRLLEFVSRSTSSLDLHTLPQIVAHLEDVSRKTGIRCNLTNDKLGRILIANKFEKIRERTVVDGQKNGPKMTQYFVKFLALENEKNPLDRI